MITGYNHNVRYEGKIYHVQTEDSGLENPHIITHLFIGGNIIETAKAEYGHLVGQADDYVPAVTQMMQTQHKTMLKGLINGRLDERLALFSKNAAHLDGPAPLNTSAGQNKVSLGFSGDMNTGAAAKDEAQPAAARPPADQTTPVETHIPAPPQDIPVPLTQPVAAMQPTADAADQPTAQVAVPAPPPPPGANIPKPATVVAKPSKPKYIEAASSEVVIAAEDLAKAFEDGDKTAVDNAIFAEDIVGEESLDSVILSYLSDDIQKGA